MADTEEVAGWTPKVRRITAPNVGEKGKLAFIRSLIGERRFDEAADELQNLLDANPRSYPGNIQMGRLLERNGQFDRAVEHFEAARAANPAQAEAAVLLGTANMRLKEFARAREAFEAALQIDSKSAAAHLGMAQVHFRKDEIDLAKTRVTQALSYDPQLQQARALLARIHTRQGDLGGSKREIEDLLSARPDQLQPMVALARIHLKSNQPEEGIKLLEGATEQHEKNAQLWGLLARAKASIADHAGAEAALRTSLGIDRKQRELIPLLIDSLVAQGKLKDARGILDKLPDVARRSGRVHAAYGQIHLAGKQYKQAAEAFRAALLRRQDDDAIESSFAEFAGDHSVVDWEAVATKYQSELDAMRKPAEPSEARDEKRKVRAKARREKARAAKG